MEAHQEEKDADRRHIGELVRGATLNLMNIQLDRQHKITDPVKFWPMPWDDIVDEDAEVKRLESMSKDERQREVQKFFDRINGK